MIPLLLCGIPSREAMTARRAELDAELARSAGTTASIGGSAEPAEDLERASEQGTAYSQLGEGAHAGGTTGGAEGG